MILQLLTRLFGKAERDKAVPFLWVSASNIKGAKTLCLS